MKPTTKKPTPKQREKWLVSAAYHEGFSAACDALLKVYSAPEHKDIREIIGAVDHMQGDTRMVRQLRSELRSKTRKA